MTQNNIKKEPDKTLPKEEKKWWQYRKMGREECGKTALLGLLGFTVCYLFSGTGVLLGVLMDIFGVVSWVCGIIWIIKTIQLKIKKKENKDQ